MQKEIAKVRFAGTGHPEDERVRDFAVMWIEKVRCAVVGFERGQILIAEMRVRFLSGKNREHEREIGVIGIQEVKPAQIHGIVAENRSKVRIERRANSGL
ncbi:MAG: hypothetical protein ABSD72_16420 [Terracidiphilus sp.]